MVLTGEEKRVIIFIVVALALGLTARHYRDAHRQAPDKIDKKHAHARGQHVLMPPTPLGKDARMHSRKKNEQAAVPP